MGEVVGAGREDVHVGDSGAGIGWVGFAFAAALSVGFVERDEV